MKKILITTGGSGGHVVPALNFYNHLKQEFEVKLYTDARGAKYIPKEINKILFDVKQTPEKKYLFPFKIIILSFAVIKSIIHLSSKKFDIIISTGGYMSLPLVLAAKLFNIKIFLFEPNSRIGRSNKLLSIFSKKIFCYDKKLHGLNKKYIDKIVELPPVLNKCFYDEFTSTTINETFKILIIGGSQSSIFFTKKLQPELIQLASKHKIEVTQQISQGFNIEKFKKEYDRNNIKNDLFFFEKDFLCKKKEFDLAITRAGASTLAELAHLNIPFISVPFPHATDNHQYFNAKRYSNLNCCWILEEKNFNSGDMYKIIDQIMFNKKEYLEKKNNLLKFKESNSWKNINNKILKCLNEN